MVQVVPSDALGAACADNEDDDYEVDDDLDEGDDFDCHMGPDGYCGAAGSEWCDWECPYNR